MSNSIQAIEKTLEDRGARYGDFTDIARICQRLKGNMSSEIGWTALPDIHKQALEVISDKIARILSGDPNYADNWHDIQGYAKLVEDRIHGSACTRPDVGQQLHELQVSSDIHQANRELAEQRLRRLAEIESQLNDLRRGMMVGAENAGRIDRLQDEKIEILSHYREQQA